MPIFENKADQLKAVKKRKMELQERLVKMLNENEDIKRKNDLIQRDVTAAAQLNVECEKETQKHKEFLVKSQEHVAKICGEESAEIHQIQAERDN